MDNLQKKNDLVTIGKAAEIAAFASVFSDYTERRPPNTIKAQRGDLRLLAEFLGSLGATVQAEELMSSGETWIGITRGTVVAFMRWLLKRGYSISTINHALSTIRVYVGLAMASGNVDVDSLAKIRSIRGYSQRDTRTFNVRRKQSRRSNKKATPVSITDEQADALKNHPATSQGDRDRLLMALLLDHGLRAGEVALLTVDSVNTADQTITFFRPKTGQTQTHRLSSDTLNAVSASLANRTDTNGPLVQGSRKGGWLTGGMSEINITKRVGVLGERIGLYGLSAHDCRHYWATRWAGKVSLLTLQEAGGWNSLAMPRRYVERKHISNEGMT